MHFSFYTDISGQSCRITLQGITSSEGNALPSPISAWEKANTTYVGQVFPLYTPQKCSQPGIYQAGRTLYLITVLGLFLLENAFLNSFIILASTSSLAMIFTIPLGEKLELLSNLFLNLIIWLGTLDFLGCIHLLHTAEDFMCLHCLQPPHFQAEGSQPAHESCSILLCPFCFSLCQFSHIFLNMRMTRITLYIQNRKGTICVYLFSLFPRKVHFKRR